MFYAAPFVFQALLPGGLLQVPHPQPEGARLRRGQYIFYSICFIMKNLVTLYAMIKQVLMPVDKPSGMITSTLARRDFKAKL